MSDVKQITILGIAGTNGSGKDTVSELLKREYGYFMGSATDMLRDELEKRGLPTDREHKSALSAEWRRQYGMSAIVDRAYEEYQAGHYSGMVVGSLRHPGEADKIHELSGIMIWVDADPQVRYKRITDNAVARGGRVEDNKTFEEFMADEEREMHPTGDAATLNGAAVKERADIFIANDGNDIAAFERQVIKALGLSETAQP